MSILGPDLFDQDLIRMTFIVGVAVSVLLYEQTHTTTGSLVVPGFIGINLLNPFGLISTAVNAVLTYLVVSKLLPRYVAVYGRVRFVSNIACSVVLSLVIGAGVPALAGPVLPGLDPIGFVLPALIAYDMNRQGVRATIEAVSVAGSLAALPALIIVLAFPRWLEPILPDSTGLFDIGPVWLPVAALTSALVAAALYSLHGLRSGGSIGAMYLALAGVRPEQVLLLVAIALVVWFVVTRLLQRWLILFGRRKFSTMLMIGSSISWIAIEMLESATPGLFDVGNAPVAVLFVPALLANDMERTSPAEVLVGVVLAASVILSVVVVLSGLVDGEPIPTWALGLAAVSLSGLFGPALSERLRPGRDRGGPDQSVEEISDVAVG